MPIARARREPPAARVPGRDRRGRVVPCRRPHRLHVAAPSISQQIRLLELEVGGPLLERLPRGARLTPAGRAFLPEARSAAARRTARAPRGARGAHARARRDRDRDRPLARGRPAAGRRSSACARPIRASSVRLHEFAHRDLLEDALDAGVGRRRDRAEPRPAGTARRSSSATSRSSSSSAGGTARSPRPSPIRLDSLADDGWILFPVTHGLHGIVVTICAAAGFVPRDAVRTAQVEAAARLAAAGRRRGDRARQHRPLRPRASTCARLDPPIFRKLAAYTRVEFSPQADALIAALGQANWVDPPAGAFLL